LKILTVASLFPNAADPIHGIFVFQRVLHLARLPGNEIKVIAPLPYFPRSLKIKHWQKPVHVPDREEIGGLPVYHPRYFLLPKISMVWQGVSIFLRCLPQVRAIHRLWKIECMDAHYVYPDGFAAVLLGKYLGIPVIVSARGSDINLLSKFRTVRLMIRWTLQQSAAVISVSQALKEAMIALGANGDRIHVVPNGVDATRFQPMISSEARRNLSLPSDGPILVSVGNLIPSKGHELVIRALALLKNKGLRPQLYILGQGPHRDTLEELAKRLDLGETIHFVGKRPNEELRSWFSAATVSCLASSREGWPNVVTESLACGTPVVATRVGGVPEILHSEELGIIVDQTIDSVAGGLERALSKNWNRSAISSQTRKRTWHQVAIEVERIFQEQLGSSAVKKQDSIATDLQNSS
jgi:glycosyltransferase involved in cell wall biosynthesis